LRRDSLAAAKAPTVRQKRPLPSRAPMTDPPQTVPSDPRPPRRWRWALGVTGTLFIAYLAAFWPHWTQATTQSGDHYDIIHVSRDGGVGQMFGPTVAPLGEAILINYYARDGGPTEAEAVLTLATPLAVQFGDSLVVVQQTQTPLSRWLPFVKGSMYAFRQVDSARWERIR
jgi:hypothetical protein